jgi:hypothetical protein
MDQLQKRMRRMPELAATMHPTGPGHLGVADRGILAMVTPERLRRILSRMLDENEFLGPCGIRSLSKFHEQHPFVFYVNGQEYKWTTCRPSRTRACSAQLQLAGAGLDAVNALIIRALLNFYLYCGDDFKIECPTGRESDEPSR